MSDQDGTFPGFENLTKQFATQRRIEAAAKEPGESDS